MVSVIPRQIRKAVQVFHISAGTGKHPYTADSTITAGFIPMDNKQHVMEGGSYVDPALLYTSPNDDIRVGDKLVINDVTYFVKKIFAAPFCGHPFKRASISTQ
jgi:hypothetical protein